MSKNLQNKYPTFLNPNLSKIWGKKARYRVLYGGRGSGKSYELATMLILASLQKDKRILCTRAFQNRIDDSIKSLLEDRIYELGVQDYFEIGRKYIKTVTGSLFMFYGLARNTKEIKGLEKIDICHIEEGQYITKDMWQILIPTIRKENSEIWISFNPQLATDFIYQEFVTNKKENSIVVKINYNQNPFLSKTALKEIEENKGNEDFAHIYLGEPKDDADKSVIKYSYIKKAIGITPVKPKEGIIISLDVAEGGEDANAIAVYKNGLIIYIDEFKYKSDELDKVAKRFFDTAKRYKAKIMVYDSIGVGAGIGALLRPMLSKAYSPTIRRFIASATPAKPNSKYTIMGTPTQIKNKEYFSNLKAQAWITLRDRLINKSFGFSENLSKDIIEKIAMELSAPYLEDIEERKIKIESKKKMLQRGIKSPNIADAIVMTTLDLSPNW